MEREVDKLERLRKVDEERVRQERARKEFPDVTFTLIVDCGDAPGYALACLRAGVATISMRTWNEKIADIARQMGAELVRRPS